MTIYNSSLYPTSLDRGEDLRILVPAQQRVLSVSRLCFLHIRPALQELFMRDDAGELAGDGAVHVFHDIEVGRKEDVEIALLNLKCDVSTVFLHRGILQSEGDDLRKVS